MSHPSDPSRTNSSSVTPASQSDDVRRAIRAIQGQRDSKAEHAIVNHFWKRVIGLAREKVESHGRMRRAFSASDVAQEAFHSFFQAIEKGNYHDLNDRKGLWNLLATITSNKVRDRIRHQRVLERHGADVGGDTALPMGFDGQRAQWAEVAIDSTANPADEVANAELCAQSLAEVCNALFPQLSPKEQETAALVAEHGVAQAAGHLGCSKRMVQIRMKAIRAKLTALRESDGKKGP